MIKKTYNKIATDWGYDCVTGCLLDYLYLKKHHKMKARNLSKRQALDANPKPNQFIIFTRNLEQVGNRVMLFIIEKAKETILDFLQRIMRVL